MTDGFDHTGKSFGGRYEARRGLGRGRHGTVYAAWDRLDEVGVAIKVLRVPDHLSEAAAADFLERFQDEAKSTRNAFRERLHVRQVLDMGAWHADDHVLAWIALELLEGITLEEHLRRRRGSATPLSERAAFDLLRPVYEAIAFAHENGIIHRDLRPANVFLADQAGGTTPVVLDFGIARVLESQGIETFSVQYGAPEQFAGEAADTATDVFALALLTTELLTDRAPLCETSDRQACMTACLDERTRPTPAARGRHVSPAVEDVLRRALAVKKHDRPPHAGAFFADLAAAVGANSIASLPPAARSLPPASSRSLPPALRSLPPASSRSLLPASSRSLPPASSRSLPPAASRSLAPAPSRSLSPAAAHPAKRSAALLPVLAIGGTAAFGAIAYLASTAISTAPSILAAGSPSTSAAPPSSYAASTASSSPPPIAASAPSAPPSSTADAPDTGAKEDASPPDPDAALIGDWKCVQQGGDEFICTIRRNIKGQLVFVRIGGLQTLAGIVQSVGNAVGFYGDFTNCRERPECRGIRGTFVRRGAHMEGVINGDTKYVFDKIKKP